MTTRAPYVAPYIKSKTGKHAVYYHTSWSMYGRNFQVKDLPIDKLTDISYAFMNVDETGKVFSGDPWADFDNAFVGNGVEPQNAWDPLPPPSNLGNLGQFYKLKNQGKKFNMTLAVGGWTWSKHFSPAVSTEAKRENFVSSLKAILERYPGLFCGVSLDWEYLSDNGVNYGLEGNVATPKDAENFIKLLKLIRKKMPGLRISMCVSAAPEKIKMPVEKIHPLLEEIHIMTYDFVDGSWGSGIVAAHHTNLKKREHCPYSTEEAVKAWSARGVPSKKLFIGAAFYSRGFSGTAGLGKPSTGGSSDMSWEKGVVDYKSLPLPGAQEFYDPVAEAAYSYDPVKKVLNSYDDVRSVTKKCKFIHDLDLGGLIIWESSADHKYEHPRSLMKVIRNKLTHGGVRNQNKAQK
jgi:chitinase